MKRAEVLKAERELRDAQWYSTYGDDPYADHELIQWAKRWGGRLIYALKETKKTR